MEEIAKALVQVAEAIQQLAREVKGLGLNGASTNLGAIEHLSKTLDEGISSICNTIRESKEVE